MKNIQKLYNILQNPAKYGTKKVTRVYKCLCILAIDGIAVTGYSNKRTKRIDTQDVMRVLNAAGVPALSYNNAPRGGACGERVELKGKVFDDARDNAAAFSVAYREKCPKAHFMDIEKAYIEHITRN